MKLLIKWFFFIALSGVLAVLITGFSKQDAAELLHLIQAQGVSISYDEVEFLNAQAEYNKRNYTDAYLKYKSLSDKGYPAAQNNLGMMIEKGEGTRRSYRDALELYRKSADQGYAEGAFNTGRLLFLGAGEIHSDYISAGQYITKSAEADLPAAIDFLRNAKKICSEDDDLDLKQSMFCTVAAQAGYADAEYKLGLIYLTANKSNNVEGIKWVRKAAEKNHAKAILNLAVGYHNGDWVKNDIAESYAWAKVLASGNYPKKLQKAGQGLLQILEREITPDQKEDGLERYKRYIDLIQNHI
jgi:uncharacterized protein